MKFTYPRNASQSSTPNPIAPLASPSSQTPILNLIQTLHNIRCNDTIEEPGLDTQEELPSCSICSSYSCLSPCWVPWCKTHSGPEPAANVPTSNKGSDREMGERSKSGRGSEGMTRAEAINADAQFWVPDWTRLSAAAAASDEQRERQRAAGEQVVGATGIIGNELGETPRTNSAATESDEDPLLALWGRTLTRATPEIPIGKVQRGALPPGTNPWSADNTFFGAYGPPPHRLRFTTLPIDHNADAHELLLSRQRKPFTDGSDLHSQPPKLPKVASRLNDLCEPGGTRRLVSCISEKVGNWLHIRKFALQSRIGERRIWLRERFDRSTRPHEVRDEGPFVTVTAEEVGNDEFGERLEKVRAGVVFDFELFRTRGRFDIDTGLPFSWN